MLLTKTKQREKAQWLTYRNRLSEYERYNALTLGSFIYIGKIKRCPKCKQEGYLKLSSANFQVQHRTRKIKGKTIWRYCTLPTIRTIIKDYDFKFMRKRRAHNPDLKKAAYDKIYHKNHSSKKK